MLNEPSITALVDVDENEGFVTTAFGSISYLHMAVDLALSVKEFSSRPISILTNHDGAAILDEMVPGLFDQILLSDESDLIAGKNPTLAKFQLGRLTPYRHSVFLDADCVLVTSIDYLWPKTRGLGLAFMSEYCQFPRDVNHHGLSTREIMLKFGITTYTKTFATIFYFERQEGIRFFSHCDTIVEHYAAKGLRSQRDQILDEIIIGIAGAEYAIQQLPGPCPIYCWDEAGTIQPETFQRPVAHPEPYSKRTFRWLHGQMLERRRKHKVALRPCKHWKNKYLQAYYNRNGPPLHLRIRRKVQGWIGLL